MISMSELINRKNNPETKQCIGFEYELTIENEAGQLVKLPVYFRRLVEFDEKAWEVNMISTKPEIRELKAYSVEFMTPVVNLELTKIAGMGLRMLQMTIQSEIQYKSIIDFSIGDVISDMF